MAWEQIPNIGQGLNRDAMPEELELGVSSDGRNMRYRYGFAERFKGMAAAYTTPSIIPYHVRQMTVGTSRYVVYTGLQKTFVDDGTTRTEITNGSNTGSTDDRWCGNVFNGVWVQNNGVDTPQYWGGVAATPLANLTAWPAGYKAGFLRPFKNYLVAGDVTRAGVRQRGTVLWSSLADPGTVPASWDITDATKEAGDESLSETNGTLIDLLPLGDMGILYKDDAIHFMQAIDSSFIFRFGRLPGDTGLLARGCVAETPAGHVLITPNMDVVSHTGQGLNSIISGRMRTWLANNVNDSQKQRSFLVTNPAFNELWICFPSGAAASCDKAIVWNWKDDTFAIRDLPSVTYGSSGQVTLNGSGTWTAATGTWDSQTQAWNDGSSNSATPRLIFSRVAPGLALVDSAENDFGNGFTATLEQTGISFGSPERVKLARGFRPRIDATAGTVVYIRIGASMAPDVYPTWQTAQAFTVGTDIEISSFAQGRFLGYQVYTTADTPWRMRGAQMDLVPMGLY